MSTKYVNLTMSIRDSIFKVRTLVATTFSITRNYYDVDWWFWSFTSSSCVGSPQPHLPSVFIFLIYVMRKFHHIIIESAIPNRSLINSHFPFWQ